MVDGNARFYDELASRYHLVYEDWNASVEGQAKKLDAFIREHWGEKVVRLLDAAAGIGTQALGLAALGYEVTASDISPKAIERAKREALERGLVLQTATADLRSLSKVHAPHQIVMAWDNALPHLLTDEDLLLAMRECFRCTLPGGGCLFSVRDYAKEVGVSPQMIPYGIRKLGATRTAVFQFRDWEGDHYEVSFCFVEDLDEACTTRVVKQGRYYAVSIERLLELMREAGFEKVRRIDGVFFQPALIGTRGAESFTP